MVFIFLAYITLYNGLQFKNIYNTKIIQWEKRVTYFEIQQWMLQWIY